MAKKVAKQTKSKGSNKQEQYNEAAMLIAKALRDPRSIPAAKAHPIAGPVMKKLGPSGIKQLSQITGSTSNTACSQI
jgi:hypothetical protein